MRRLGFVTRRFGNAARIACAASTLAAGLYLAWTGVVPAADSTPTTPVPTGFATAGPVSAVGDNWPRFRGPNGSGVSTDKSIPVRWTDKEYLWKTPIPGLGHSAPCVWEDSVFLTTALDEGRRRAVVCVKASNGEVRWLRELASAKTPKSEKNSHASSTPATDGERVYVAFSTATEYTLAAFDFAGKELWKRNLGPFVSNHGSGTSPIVWQDTVFLAGDQDQPSFITAVDSKTGETRWRVERRAGYSAFATPLILEGPGLAPQVVFASTAEGLAGFDARTGRQLWHTERFEQRVVSSPVYAGGLVFQQSGSSGAGHLLVAVRPPSMSPSDAPVELAWRRTRALPYVPTLVAYAEHLYLWGDTGVVSCAVASTGRNVWTGRVEGKFSGSPICVDGKLYCISEDGEVVVVKAGPKFELLARNTLGEPSRSTPAVSRGRMFFRGSQHLFCVGRPPI